MDWKKLGCAAVLGLGLGLGLSACGADGYQAYEGRFTAVATYADGSRALSRLGPTVISGYEHGLEITLNPDLCPLEADRDDQGRLQLTPGTVCQLRPDLAPREGTFIAVLDEQVAVESDGRLVLQLHGTIHQDDAQAPSEGELVVFFQGAAATE